MVPVPEQHVEEVMTFLTWYRRPAQSSGWDIEGVSSLISRLDETGRRFLLHTAQAASDVVVTTVRETATAVGTSEREVLGMVSELNDLIRAAGGPPLTIATALIRGRPDTGPGGWSVNMPGEIARFMLVAARPKGH
jgi:hypothetical protein